MDGKKIRIGAMVLTAAVWLGLAVVTWLKPADILSEAERRQLTQFPEISGQTLLSGKFSEEFEKYSLDQFPLRDGFRALKAGFQYHVAGQGDNNGIYLSQGHFAKLDYPYNPDSLSYATGIFNWLRENCLQDSQIWVSVIPDKGYYLTQDSSYPAMDYDALVSQLQQEMPYASYVNLFDTLSSYDYYRTDTHWRQENLLGTAQRLCNALGVTPPKESDFRKTTLTTDFYGVYAGQAAYPTKADSLTVLESDILGSCQVYNFETDTTGPVYDLDRLSGMDPYEVFLSGPVSLLTIENPNAKTDRELIIFRDSFGSAIAPLLVEDYKSITLIDIRYLSPRLLSRFVDFHGQDVLFLYSTLVLNSSSALQK